MIQETTFKDRVIAALHARAEHWRAEAAKLAEESADQDVRVIRADEAEDLARMVARMEDANVH